MKVKSLSRARLLATPCAAAHGSSVHGIFQARVLEWGAIAYSQVFSNSREFYLYVITRLEQDILECEVKWALESITTNKASGGDGIPVVWGSQEGCQGPSRPSGRNRGLPLRRRRGQGPHLARHGTSTSFVRTDAF